MSSAYGLSQGKGYFESILESGMEEFAPLSNSDNTIKEGTITGTSRWINHKLRSPDLRVAANGPMDMASARQNEGTMLYCFSDPNQSRYRIYFNDCTEIECTIYQNKLCKCLDRLNENQCLTLYLGNGIYENNNSVYLGSIIDAMEHCKADITTVINGRAGAVETYLWLYGKQRIVSPYGTLCFRGAYGVTETFRYWGDYFGTIFTKAKDLGLLTEIDYTNLMTTDDTLYISYAEYLAKVSH